MSNFKRMQLRIPLNLRDWLKDQADNNGRSMNAEFIELLREAKAKEAKEAEKT